MGVFIISLLVLIKSSDYFTDSAEKIGIHFGISAFIIGVTIIAVGTSLPELVSSIIAVLNNSSEIIVGTVVGSNICNIFLVLGLAAIFSKKTIEIGCELIHVDLPFIVGSSFLLAVTIWDGIFTSSEALLCLACLIIFIYYTLNTERTHENPEVEKEMKAKTRKSKMDKKTVLVLIVSSIFIYLGANYTVESVIKLSELLGIGKL